MRRMQILQMPALVTVSFLVAIYTSLGQSNCPRQSIVDRWPSLVIAHAVEPLEWRVANARQYIDEFGPGCIPTLVEMLSGTESNVQVKTGAAYTVGLLGIVYDASAAVQPLIDLIESYEGKALEQDARSCVYYAHLSLGRIGTAHARNFLFARAKADYWTTRQGFWRRSLGPEKLPPKVCAQGAAIQAIGFIGDDEAEQFLRSTLGSAEFSSPNAFRGADNREGDLRHGLNLALEISARERAFKHYIRSGETVRSETQRAQ